eukprot:1330033-Alexandrium_andersonii.AAC.1
MPRSEPKPRPPRANTHANRHNDPRYWQPPNLLPQAEHKASPRAEQARRTDRCRASWPKPSARRCH